MEHEWLGSEIVRQLDSWIAVRLAREGNVVVLCDVDVESPNDHLLLNQKLNLAIMRNVVSAGFALSRVWARLSLELWKSFIPVVGCVGIYDRVERLKLKGK